MNENLGGNAPGFYLGRMLAVDFDQAIEKVVKGMKEEGFGILSDIDMEQLMKEKMNVSLGRHRVLSALNLQLAFKMMGESRQASVMLPLSLIFKEKAPGVVEAAAMDPMNCSDMGGDNSAAKIAGELREKICRVFLAL